MSDVPVIRWEMQCWQCDRETPVIWPEEGYLDSELGEALAASEENDVQRVYSKLQDKEVWGNVCEHCGSYQDNHRVHREAVQQEPPTVECEVCGEEHEWYPDEGLNVAVGQGWVDCPEVGAISTRDPRARPGDDGAE